MGEGQTWSNRSAWEGERASEERKRPSDRVRLRDLRSSSKKLSRWPSESHPFGSNCIEFHVESSTMTMWMPSPSCIKKGHSEGVYLGAAAAILIVYTVTEQQQPLLRS